MPVSIRHLFLLVVLVATACGSTAEPAVAPADPSTTVSPTTEAAAPSTTEPPTTTIAETTTTTTELDNSALGRSATWDVYRSLVPTERAIQCALKVELDPNFVRTIPEEIVNGELFDVWFEADREDTEETDALYRALVVELDATEYEPGLRKIAAGLDILQSTTDLASAQDTFARSAAEVEIMLAEIDGGAATVDVAPYLRIAFDETFAAYETDNGCPFTGGTDSPIASAMVNFAGTNERFGGRGPDARSRCHISAAIDLALEATANGESFESHVDSAFDMFDQQWFDRPIDEGAVSVAAMWRDGRVAGGDLDALAAATLEQWLAYRDGAPEGFILCPLDRGWEA